MAKDLPVLDATDRRLLTELQADAALTHAALAERLNTSPASVWRRIRALETARVLGPAVRLVDPAMLGFGVTVLCNIRVRSYSREVRASFEEFVRSRPEIPECFSMSGEWDYLLRIVAMDVSDYERFLMRALLEHLAVGAAASHFALSVTKFETALPTGQ